MSEIQLMTLVYSLVYVLCSHADSSCPGYWHMYAIPSYLWWRFRETSTCVWQSWETKVGMLLTQACPMVINHHHNSDKQNNESWLFMKVLEGFWDLGFGIWDLTFTNSECMLCIVEKELVQIYRGVIHVKSAQVWHDAHGFGCTCV